MAQEAGRLKQRRYKKQKEKSQARLQHMHDRFTRFQGDLLSGEAGIEEQVDALLATQQDIVVGELGRQVDLGLNALAKSTLDFQGRLQQRLEDSLALLQQTVEDTEISRAGLLQVSRPDVSGPRARHAEL